MKYGYIIMNYYTTKDCVGQIIQQVKYSIEKQKLLYFLNSGHFLFWLEKLEMTKYSLLSSLRK